MLVVVSFACVVFVLALFHLIVVCFIVSHAISPIQSIPPPLPLPSASVDG